MLGDFGPEFVQNGPELIGDGPRHLRNTSGTFLGQIIVSEKNSKISCKVDMSQTVFFLGKYGSNLN